MNLFSRFILFFSNAQQLKKERGYFFVTHFILKRIRHKIFRVFVIPFAVLVTCLRPWVKIRFLPISCLTIGHYSLMLEILLCKMDEERGDREKEKIIFLQRPRSEVCNTQLYDMWKRVLPFSPDVLFPLCSEIESYLAHWFGAPSHKTLLSQAIYDRWDILEKSKQHLRFTQSELQEGKRILMNMGIPADALFICLLVRDQAYYIGDKAYNDLSSYRNADISTYRKAALFLAEKGYYVIRMGKKVSDSFELNHARIIDYANSPFRSDFMDVYLSAYCYFFMTTYCGLDGVAQAFRRPVLVTNVTPNGYCYLGYPVVLFLAKKIINESTGQLLSFKRQNKIFRFESLHEFIHKMMRVHTLKMIDNTEDEILEATQEMLLRMQGQWYETALSEELHHKLWFEMTHHVYEGAVLKAPLPKYQARYCMADLLKNKELLENETVRDEIAIACE